MLNPSQIWLFSTHAQPTAPGLYTQKHAAMEIIGGSIGAQTPVGRYLISALAKTKPINGSITPAPTVALTQKPFSISTVKQVGAEDSRLDTPIADNWGQGARVGFNIDNKRPFTGLMDDLNVWKRGLTKEEVNMIMEDGVDAFLAVEAQGKLATDLGKTQGIEIR